MTQNTQAHPKDHEFGEFLGSNPYSRLGEIDQQQAKQSVVFSPWGDDSILLNIEHPSLALSAALNSVVLPEHFSAIYHKDQAALEFIYSAFPLKAEIKTRSFDFFFKGRNHKCQFGPCSDRLLVIAEHFRPGHRSTTTDYRNLVFIQAYVFQKKRIPQPFDTHTYPLSTGNWNRLNGIV